VAGGADSGRPLPGTGGQPTADRTGPASPVIDGVREELAEGTLDTEADPLVRAECASTMERYCRDWTLSTRGDAAAVGRGLQNYDRPYLEMLTWDEEFACSYLTSQADLLSYITVFTGIVWADSRMPWVGRVGPDEVLPFIRLASFIGRRGRAQRVRLLLPPGGRPLAVPVVPGDRLPHHPCPQPGRGAGSY